MNRDIILSRAVFVEHKYSGHAFHYIMFCVHNSWNLLLKFSSFFELKNTQRAKAKTNLGIPKRYTLLARILTRKHSYYYCLPFTLIKKSKTIVLYGSGAVHLHLCRIVTMRQEAKVCYVFVSAEIRSNRGIHIATDYFNTYVPNVPHFMKHQRFRVALVLTMFMINQFKNRRNLVVRIHVDFICTHIFCATPNRFVGRINSFQANLI